MSTLVGPRLGGATGTLGMAWSSSQSRSYHWTLAIGSAESEAVGLICAVATTLILDISHFAEVIATAFKCDLLPHTKHCLYDTTNIMKLIFDRDLNGTQFSVFCILLLCIGWAMITQIELWI